MWQPVLTPNNEVLSVVLKKDVTYFVSARDGRFRLRVAGSPFIVVEYDVDKGSFHDFKIYDDMPVGVRYENEVRVMVEGWVGFLPLAPSINGHVMEAKWTSLDSPPQELR